MIGFHVQKPPNDGPAAIAKLPAGTPVLAVDNVQYLDECKRVNPGVFTVLRHWADDMQVFPLDWDFEAYKQHAQNFFATFIDGTFRKHAAQVDAVKEFNEYWANSQNDEERRARVWWCRAAAEVWRDEYRSQGDYEHIRLVIGSAAIGNDMPAEVGAIAQQYDCIVSYHAYWYTVKGQQPDNEWRDLSGRWNVMDQEWQALGHHVDWLMTECGPFESAVTGWRSSEVCGGSVDCYLGSILYWLNHAAATDAYKAGRLLGGVLFTTFAGGNWPGFDTQQPELNAIADLVREWTPEEPPKPPANRVRLTATTNIRLSPRYSGIAGGYNRLTTLPAGSEFRFLHETTGESWRGSRKWYVLELDVAWENGGEAIKAYCHSALAEVI